MEIVLSEDFSSVSLFVAVVATASCCVFALWSLRSFSLSNSVFRRSRRSDGFGGSMAKKNCCCSCSCESSVVGVNGEKTERRTALGSEGASMMEQLVPEITTHALSYLDYPSLCRLSMTNSLMRRAANDDNAWKALYHKAYYAATRAIMNINAEFYNIIRESSLQAMRRLWLQADYVKCIHGSGELFSGYDAVLESWRMSFTLGPGIAFQIRDVRVRVLTEMAWVTMQAFVDVIEVGPFHVTNVFEFDKGQWYMVHHHCSVMLPDAEVDHQNWQVMFGLQ
ncbi:hypothetical protein Syun_013421 [Stephania yunnanensis]|uniref:F-box domain-containing protein n=1 Tax=Stephania yunnanensis TaxID=152371 RepID=A0AAP0K1E9_9MAGN